MVDAVNLQHVLARAMMAEDVKQTSKDKNLVDKKAFNEQLQKAEKLKEAQIHDTKESGTDNRIRDQEEQKEGRRNQQERREEEEEKPVEDGEDSLNDVPQAANPDLLNGEEHKIDLQA